MLAVGEHTFGRVDNQTLKLSTGFAAGVGETRQDPCGALSAGIIFIGAMLLACRRLGQGVLSE
jgi:hypothetical protein